MLGIDQERVSCNVRRLGILMEQPRAVLYCHPVNLKDLWKLFHQLKQFNWLVAEQMPPGWIPKCGSCGYFTDMQKHGKSSPPQLVKHCRRKLKPRGPRLGSSWQKQPKQRQLFGNLHPVKKRDGTRKVMPSWHKY
eukprot:scaffold1954_cov33-Attheya_sp.AAC.5